MSNTDQNLEILRPQVKLIAQTCIVDVELLDEVYGSNSQSYISAQNDGEALVEFAGRSCYQSFNNPSGRTNAEYIANIKQQRHFSVLEHTHCTFYITGVSRSFTHDLIRHRHFNYSQLSQRFVDSRHTGYVPPPLMQEDKALLSLWEEAVTKNREYLRRLEEAAFARHPELPKKQIREAVRSVAQNSIETRIAVTGNLRSWIEMLEKRTSEHADKEFQTVAWLLYDVLEKEYPAVFSNLNLAKE